MAGKIPGWLGGEHTGHGWDSLLRSLHEELEKLDPGYEVVQVKEKFGIVRVYLKHYAEGTADLIYKAERVSAVTCERCGKPGKRGIVSAHWVRTLCDEHRATQSQGGRWQEKPRMKGKYE